jgi:hypothetical protein
VYSGQVNGWLRREKLQDRPRGFAVGVLTSSPGRSGYGGRGCETAMEQSCSKAVAVGGGTRRGPFLVVRASEAGGWSRCWFGLGPGCVGRFSREGARVGGRRGVAERREQKNS